MRLGKLAEWLHIGARSAAGERKPPGLPGGDFVSLTKWSAKAYARCAVERRPQLLIAYVCFPRRLRPIFNGIRSNPTRQYAVVSPPGLRGYLDGEHQNQGSPIIESGVIEDRALRQVVLSLQSARNWR